jgi:hypothetical protein
MFRKAILHFAGAVTLGCTINGATLLVAPDATQYMFRDWSSPEPLALDSPSGPVQVFKRTNFVNRMSPQHTECLAIDLLYSPTAQTVLITPPYEHYFAIGEQIYGATTKGTVLLVKGSDSPGSEIETFMERAIAGFMKDPRTALSVEGATYAFPAPITRVGVESGSVTFAFRTDSGNVLSLVFTTEFMLISATKNGKMFPVLQDGRFPLANDWSGPREIFLPSREGEVTGLGSSKIYFRDDKLYYSEEAKGRRVYPVRTVIIPDTGDIWIGPIDSRLVLLNRGMLGFILNSEKELLLFAGRGSRLPMGQAARAALQEEISKFERDLLSGRFTEHARISIPLLFPGVQSISEASELTIKEILFVGSSAVLQLKADGPNAEVQVTISPELRVTSTSKISQSRP